MELITYLNKYYLTKDELLEGAKISAEQFTEYQRAGVMPKCSYTLTLDLASESFFGPHQEKQTIEYYARGYLAWLGMLQATENKEAPYVLFSQRYEAAINALKEQGHQSDNAKVNQGLEKHIQEEWGYFIDGIYGLCTKTGLPEDIAAKELAIIQIEGLITNTELDDTQRTKLENAVNLLDKVSSLFAPHERQRSSRHRLIDEVRRKYQFQA